VSNRDNRDFRPSRRRDFVDDDYQPPSRDFGYGAPRGAQFDVPSGPPVQAIVKWYNPIKGFGFVELGDGSGDAFLHVSIVERAGEETIPPGATLEVRAGPGQRGLQITEIITVDTSTASQAGPRRRPDDRATVEETGTVKWYNATKGFGFVAPVAAGRTFSPMPRRYNAPASWAWPKGSASRLTSPTVRKGRRRLASG